MNVWGRRIVVFLLVLGIGLVAMQAIRRRTAQASARTVTHAPAELAPRLTAPLTAAPSAPMPASEATAPSKVSASVTAAPATRSASAALPTSNALGSRTFHDRNYKVAFDYPANWTFSDKDHEISTFRLDARTADRKTQMRAVTAIPNNPYPSSTFTGAYVYLSVTPHSNQARCAGQATPTGGSQEMSQIAGMKFAHGHDEQKNICTVERDEIYTTYRKGACYRFDLAINNFCGGEVSGVKDITQQELDAVRARLESIVSTVRFDGK
jgi:hypothetical protein